MRLVSLIKVIIIILFILILVINYFMHCYFEKSIIINNLNSNFKNYFIINYYFIFQDKMKEKIIHFILSIIFIFNYKLTFINSYCFKLNLNLNSTN